MNYSYYGFHITNVDEIPLLTSLDIMNPRGNVVVSGTRNHSAFTRQLCDRYPNSWVIGRRWWPHKDWGDDNQHRELRGEDWAQQMADYYSGDKRVVLQWCNEPHWAGMSPVEKLNDMQLLVERTIAAYKTARKLGFTVCGPNFGVTYPHTDEAIALADIFRAAVEYGHFVGIHPYAGKTFYEQIVPTPQGNWYIGSQWFTEAMERMLDIAPDLRFMGTEGGWDVIGGIPGSDKFKTMGLTQPDMRDQLVYAQNTHFAGWPLEFITLFAYATSNTQDKWHTTSYHDQYDLHVSLGSHPWPTWVKIAPSVNNEEPEQPMEYEDQLYSIIGALNLRASATTAAAILDNWQAGTEFYRSVATSEANGYTWYHVKHAATGAVGYMANYQDYMQPIADPPPDPAPDPTLEQRLDDLEAQMVQVFERLDTLEADGGQGGLRELFEKMKLFYADEAAAMEAVSHAAGTFKEYCEEQLAE